MLYGNSQLTVAPCVAGRATASYTPCALVGVLLAPTSEPLTTLASPQPVVLVADLEYKLLQGLKKVLCGLISYTKSGGAI